MKQRKIPFKVSASVDLDDPPPSGNLPVFKTFNVSDGDNGPLVNASDVEEMIDKSPERLQKERLKSGNVTLESVSQTMNLEAI